MTPYRSKKRKGLVIMVVAAVVVVSVVSVLAAGCGSAGSTAGTDDTGLSADLNGAGATFPQPVYVEWIGGFQTANPGVRVNYQGVGSGAGIEQVHISDRRFRRHRRLHEG